MVFPRISHKRLDHLKRKQVLWQHGILKECMGNWPERAGAIVWQNVDAPGKLCKDPTRIDAWFTTWTKEIQQMLGQSRLGWVSRCSRITLLWPLKLWMWFPKVPKGSWCLCSASTGYIQKLKRINQFSLSILEGPTCFGSFPRFAKVTIITTQAGSLPLNAVLQVDTTMV